MAAAFEAAYPWPVEGLVITRTGFGCETRAIQVIDASHPVPDETSERAGHALLEAMAATSKNDRVVFLLSGGCSSLIFTPVPQLEKDKVWQFLTELLDSGLPVEAMNRIRQALSLTGGGRLAAICPGNLITLAISDVVGDRPEDIGSAPTSHPTALLQEDLYKLNSSIRTSFPDILSFLLQSQPCRHPRIDAAARAYHIIAASSQALESASRSADCLGVAELLCEPDATGEVRMTVARHAKKAISARRAGRPVLFLSGGELTVAMNPKSRTSAKGGPNQEYALRLCQTFHGMGIQATILSIDTDGIDGRGDAAGGLISTDTYDRLLRQNVDVDDLLEHNDSYRALSAAGALLKSGPTGTNVNDFRAVFLSAYAEPGSVVSARCCQSNANRSPATYIGELARRREARATRRGRRFGAI